MEGGCVHYPLRTYMTESFYTRSNNTKQLDEEWVIFQLHSQILTLAALSWETLKFAKVSVLLIQAIKFSNRIMVQRHWR